MGLTRFLIASSMPLQEAVTAAQWLRVFGRIKVLEKQPRAWDLQLGGTLTI